MPIVTLADRRDAQHFAVGTETVLEPVYYGSPPMIIGYRKMPEWKMWAQRRWHRLTKFFRKRDVVSAVDVEAGTITLRRDHRWWRFL